VGVEAIQGPVLIRTFVMQVSSKQCPCHASA